MSRPELDEFHEPDEAIERCEEVQIRSPHRRLGRQASWDGGRAVNAQKYVEYWSFSIGCTPEINGEMNDWQGKWVMQGADRSLCSVTGASLLAGSRKVPMIMYDDQERAVLNPTDYELCD